MKEWVGLLLRLVVGVVWIVAGALKLPDPAQSVAAVRAYQLLPGDLATPVGQLLPVIEVVSSRFADYTAAPLLDRLCDLMSNGALVTGDPVADWTDRDLPRLPVRLVKNDEILIEREGGHPQSDPCGWALALINELRAEGVPAGLTVTTGSCTGIVYGAPGDRFRAEFSGFSPVSLQFG